MAAKRRVAKAPVLHGRTKLTAELTEQLRLAVRGGASLRNASRAYGVEYTLVRKWIAKGTKHARSCTKPDEVTRVDNRNVTVVRCKAAEHPFTSFYATLDRARGELVVELSARLTSMAQRGNLEAITRLLRQLEPEEWTPTERRDVQVMLRELAPKQWAKVPRGGIAAVDEEGADEEA